MRREVRNLILVPSAKSTASRTLRIMWFGENPRIRTLESVSGLGLWMCNLLAALVLWLGAAAQLAAQPNQPRIGYVYPAGGLVGSTFRVVVGGQFLATVTNAFVSCPDVDAKMLEYNRPMAPKQFSELRDKLRELEQKRRAARRVPGSTNAWTAADEKQLTELRAKLLKNPPNRQATPAIAETITLEIAIGTNAPIGAHELRLIGTNGLSNPLRFYVGQYNEFTKPPVRAPNPDLDKLLERLGGKPQLPRYTARIRLPAVLNGQILPGGSDRYSFSARKGQRIVVAVAARQLIPYLADAVPGWFQAVLTLYDNAGRELACVDDFRFNPDPVLCFDVPKDGLYEIEVHDALYRGREDFVYRITIGEVPFLTGLFPLGCSAGQPTKVTLTGWNLAETNQTIEVNFPLPGIHELVVTNAGRVSNPMPFAVDTLPECIETEPNNSQATAQAIVAPVIVNGRINAPGDVDVFRFEPNDGAEIVVEVIARRLDSPLDSVLRVTDAAGNQIAANDDSDDKSFGLITHQADSYLHVRCPSGGPVYVHVCDAQRKGGPDYAYRLRVSPPRHDFALMIVPSSLSVRAGMNVPLTVYALRKDSFTNEITLVLSNAPDGFSLAGARIGPGQDNVRLTLKAPRLPTLEPVALSVVGVATIGGHNVVRHAVPADDFMQAFAYHHLVPANELCVMVLPNRRPRVMAGVQVLSTTPVKIPAGGTATVQISMPVPALANQFEFELDSPPDGITLQSVEPFDRGIQLEIGADPARVKPGVKGNLIVNVTPGRLQQAGSEPATRPQAQRRVPIATFPAIPFEIVGQE